MTEVYCTAADVSDVLRKEEAMEGDDFKRWVLLCASGPPLSTNPKRKGGGQFEILAVERERTVLKGPPLNGS